MICQDRFTVDSRDVDGQNQIRPSALLGYLQEAAVQAALELGVDRDKMVEQHNCIWMLARMWYRMERPLHFNETVTVETWHRGGKGAAMYRDFDLFVDGEKVGEAVSVWVLADVDTRRLLRFSKVEAFQRDTTGGERCKTLQLSNLKPPEGLERAEDRRLYYSDTDINGHVNNVHYADFACDALHMERLGQGKYVSQLQVSYLSECQPGEIMELYTGREEDGCFVLGQDQAGKHRFTALLRLEPLA